MNINEILESLINHKVTLHYTQHEESTLRETSGILKQVNKDTIQLILFGEYGEPYTYYLNRHSCVLLSISDEGEK